MGHCCTKHAVVENETTAGNPPQTPKPSAAVTNGRSASNTPNHSFTGSPWQTSYPAGVPPTPSPARTPKRMFKWPFPPPSPAKPIMSAILKRQGKGRGTPRLRRRAPGPSLRMTPETERGLWTRVSGTRGVSGQNTSWGRRWEEVILGILVGQNVKRVFLRINLLLSRLFQNQRWV
ncbi:hypothetical protein R6Q59_000140 [Mikania micrantha]